MQGFLDRLMPARTARRKMTVASAREVLKQQELEKLIDQDQMIAGAIERTEQSGIVFLDEIDKVCGAEGLGGDVSREGVQRDLLPLVEGKPDVVLHSRRRRRSATWARTTCCAALMISKLSLPMAVAEYPASAAVDRSQAMTVT